MIDSGSQINKITQNCLEQLNPRPILRSMDDFGLDIRSAGGHSIPYKGYVIVDVSAPFIDGVSKLIPMLVVPLTEYNKTVPVIVGTNILNLFHDVEISKNQVPDSWKTAFNA